MTPRPECLTVSRARPGSHGSAAQDGRRCPLDRGYVQIYTGNGKGKTTAALGLAVRAACAGLRVGVFQFMKGGPTSEQALVERFPGLIEMRQLGRPGFIGPGGPSPEDIRLAEAGLSELTDIFEKAGSPGATDVCPGLFDVVVADEILAAVTFGLLSEQAVLDLIRIRPAGTELVLTGRYSGTGALLDAADLVTEMKEIRHYWKSGVEARKGIEF